MALCFSRPQTQRLLRSLALTKPLRLYCSRKRLRRGAPSVSGWFSPTDDLALALFLLTCCQNWESLTKEPSVTRKFVFFWGAQMGLLRRVQSPTLWWRTSFHSSSHSAVRQHQRFLSPMSADRCVWIHLLAALCNFMVWIYEGYFWILTAAIFVLLQLLLFAHPAEYEKIRASYEEASKSFRRKVCTAALLS